MVPPSFCGEEPVVADLMLMSQNQRAAYYLYKNEYLLILPKTPKISKTPGLARPVTLG